MLDTEVLKHLPDELKARLVEFEATFSTKGWNYIQEWAQKSADEQRDRMLFCTTWEQYVNLQGRWFAFTELANLEDATYKEFEGLAQQAAEQAIEEIEIEYE